MKKEEFDKLFNELTDSIDSQVVTKGHQLYDELVKAGDNQALITALFTESRAYTNNLVYHLFLKLVVEPPPPQS